MLRERWQTVSQQVTEQVGGWWTRQNSAASDLPAYLLMAFRNYLRYGTRQSASLSYYAIFSIFPLVLLGAVLVSAIFGPVVAQQQITLVLSPFLPANATQVFDLFTENLAQALDQGATFGLVALVSLVWSGLGLFSNITWSLDLIFQVPASRSLWRQRVVAIGMATVLMILLVSSFLTSAGLRIASALLLERPSLWINIGALFLPLGLNLVIFALLFRYVPARRVYWDAVWPAAIFGAVGWEIAKFGFGWYLTNVADYQFVYGSIATVIVLLFWAYLVASIFLISAEICAQLNNWLHQRHWEQQSDAFIEAQIATVPDDEEARRLSSGGERR